MTVTEILDSARDLYNATGDTFFSDTKMYFWLQQACNILAKKAYVIEGSSTSSSVIGTQSYAYPTNSFAVRRLLYNGRKVRRIDQRSDDSVTLSNASTTQQGTPIYYTDWSKTIYFRPIPDAVNTISWFTYDLQPAISASTTLSLPTEFHMDTVSYLLWWMFSKDKDNASASFHKGEWDKSVMEAIAYWRKRKRTDSFATVLDEDNIPSTVLGEL